MQNLYQQWQRFSNLIMQTLSSEIEKFLRILEEQCQFQNE